LLVAQGLVSDHEPGVRAVVPAQPRFQFRRRSQRECALDRRAHGIEILGVIERRVDGVRVKALLQRAAEERETGAVDVAEGPVGVQHADQLRNEVHQDLQFRGPLGDPSFKLLGGAPPLAHVPRLLQRDRGLVGRDLEQQTLDLRGELYSS